MSVLVLDQLAYVGVPTSRYMYRLIIVIWYVLYYCFFSFIAFPKYSLLSFRQICYAKLIVPIGLIYFDVW